ncbi:MAG: oxidoreductase [Anaerosolibacter sp.]|jgi:ferredoxin-NADP reductase|uniref:FAD-dependent oxidoreductase n=1 Tax=Anaerosolibacter sp. TaxID=1872527 RepID=UPI002610B854|nr:FAD-dependent oxidoreductase [Anaerosolibacter sp.]MDF2547835.1 oxidoreductase [Anaerosolibacter sp.]
MGFLKDFLPVFTKNRLIFSGKKQEGKDVVTFFFKSEKMIHWKPGQHGIFTFDNLKLSGKKWRAFSVASTQDEGHVMISMHIPAKPSSYKEAFQNLKPGDTITMKGPFGPFYVEDISKPVICIAGGIGITPVRSILTSITQNKEAGPKSMHLLYTSSNGEYFYKDEIDRMMNGRDDLYVQYISGREELNQALSTYMIQYGNDAYYYISGSEGMVKSIKEVLMKQGISKKNIKNDPFLGY